MDSHGTVVVTTTRNARAVKMLGEYWSAKSLFLKVRKNPNLLNDREYQEKTLAFLENNTSLSKQPLWANLNREQKLILTKYLRLQEVDSKTLRLDSTSQNAQLFVIINGSVSVKYPQIPDSLNYSVGELFGSCKEFNQMCKKYGPRMSFYDDDNGDVENDEPTFKGTATVESGKFTTLLQISSDDYYNYILQYNAADEAAQAAELEKQRLRLEDQQIADIPYDQLTESDKKYIQVFRKARRALSKDIFGFLDTFKYIPRNAQTGAHKYHKVNDMGSEILLSSGEFANTIIFIIEGAIRLDIVANGNSNKNTNIISFKRKGSKSMTMKQKLLPLMLLESGSILNLTSDTFSGTNLTLQSRPGTSQPPPTPSRKSTRKPKKSSTVTLPPLSGATQPDQKFFTGSTGKAASIPVFSLTGTQSEYTAANSLNPSRANSPNPTLKGRKNAFRPPKPLYSLRLTFERPTSYLTLPHSAVEEKINNERLADPEFGDHLWRQISYASKAIQSRISALIPWITGSMELTPDAAAPAPFRTLSFVEESFQHQSTGSFTFKSASVFENVSSISASEGTVPVPVADRRPKFDAMLEKITEKMNDSFFVTSSPLPPGDSNPISMHYNVPAIEYPSQEDKSILTDPTALLGVGENAFGTNNNSIVDATAISVRSKSVSVREQKDFTDDLQDDSFHSEKIV